MTMPRIGVWSLQHGDEEADEDDASGAWEVLCGKPVTYITLQARNGMTEEAMILCASAMATDRTSITRNRNRCYWRARAVHSAKVKGDCPFKFIHLAPKGSAWQCAKRYESRTKEGIHRGVIRGSARIASKTIASRIREAWAPQRWFCAFRFQNGVPGPHDDFSRFHPMVPPKGRFWADPFPACMDGKHYVFFKEYVYALKRARIAVSEVTADGRFSEPRVALDRPYHVSYPYVFRWSGQWYMVPESFANRTIELWRCVGSSEQWVFDRNLMDNVLAADSTIVEIEGRFWMFTCIIADEHLPCDELFLFSADSPLGPWQPHRRNPVVSDARCARPAGRLFLRNGKWLRPAQDCTGHYGRRIRSAKSCG